MLTLIYIRLGLFVAILLGVWWARFHLTKVLIPHELTNAVESEGFRVWLGECGCWRIWGRDPDGRYYAIARGWLGARAILKKAKSLD
jgi:hypothetical protein